MTAMRASGSRGVTLTELVIVMALATLVMLSLTSFYFASQSTWLDASTQALTQQDATLVTSEIAQWVQQASAVDVNIVDPLHNTLTLSDKNGNQIQQFIWSPVDSLLRDGTGSVVANSKVMRFQLTKIADSLLVLDLLEMKSADGRLVETATTFARYNRP